MTPATTSWAPSWTCNRCGVTTRYLPGRGTGEPPAGWSVDASDTHCLNCRRDLAAEAAYDRADPGMSRADRVKLLSKGRIEFEITRQPDRTNGEIARSVGCSVAAVLKARRQLEASSRR